MMVTSCVFSQNGVILTPKANDIFHLPVPEKLDTDTFEKYVGAIVTSIFFAYYTLSDGTRNTCSCTGIISYVFISNYVTPYRVTQSQYKRFCKDLGHVQ